MVSEMGVMVEGSVNNVGLSRHIQGFMGMSRNCNTTDVGEWSENVWVPIWSLPPDW